MRRVRTLLRAAGLLAAALAGPWAALPARAEEAGEGEARYEHVHVVDFEGEIEPALTAYAERRIAQAEEAGADLIVFRIESPGGRVDATLDLSDRIQRVRKGVRTLAWVPEYAYSGAAIVAISCDEIVMGPRAFLGDAQPILVGPEGVTPVGEKAETVLRARVRALAEDNGYPSLLAEKLISQDMEVALLEAKEGARAFVVGEEWRDAKDADEVAGRPKSEWRRTRVFPRGQLLTMRATEAKDLGFARIVDAEKALLDGLSAPGATVVHHRMTLSERAGRWLLGFAGVLGALAVLGLLMTVLRGIGLHSLVALAGIVLVVLIGATADLAQGFPLLLVLVGVLLILVEAFLVPGFGIPGILGIACFCAGLLFAVTGYRPGDDPATVDGDAIRTFATQLVLTLLVGSVALVALTRLFPSSPFGRKLLLPEGSLPAGAIAVPTGTSVVGSPSREGTAVTPLRPAGTARLGDALVDVVTVGDFVDAGARVRVVRVEGSRVVVRPVGA